MDSTKKSCLVNLVWWIILLASLSCVVIAIVVLVIHSDISDWSQGSCHLTNPLRKDYISDHHAIIDTRAIVDTSDEEDVSIHVQILYPPPPDWYYLKKT